MRLRCLRVSEVAKHEPKDWVQAQMYGDTVEVLQVTTFGILEK